MLARKKGRELQVRCREVARRFDGGGWLDTDVGMDSEGRRWRKVAEVDQRAADAGA